MSSNVIVMNWGVDVRAIPPGIAVETQAQSGSLHDSAVQSATLHAAAQSFAQLPQFSPVSQMPSLSQAPDPTGLHVGGPL
jgi:hypothetical protein